MYNVKQFATLFFGVRAYDVNNVNEKRYRHISRVIVHEGYRQVLEKGQKSNASFIHYLVNNC